MRVKGLMSEIIDINAKGCPSGFYKTSNGPPFWCVCDNKIGSIDNLGCHFDKCPFNPDRPLEDYTGPSGFKPSDSCLKLSEFPGGEWIYSNTLGTFQAFGYLGTFSNFSCMFLNPNNFFQFE